MKRIVGICFVLVLLAPGALAQDQTQRVDRQQASQHQRIRQGWVNGELTRRETARLIAAQRFIVRREWLAKADGNVTPAEKIRLHRMSRQIYRERHDRQRLY